MLCIVQLSLVWCSSSFKRYRLLKHHRQVPRRAGGPWSGASEDRDRTGLVIWETDEQWLELPFEH